MQDLFYHDTQIIKRTSDGYVLVTPISQRYNKIAKDWLKLDSTKAYIQELSVDRRILPSDFARIQKGGDNTKQGTWLHPELIIDYAMWLNPKFKVWCMNHLQQLLRTGETSISAPRKKLCHQQVLQNLKPLKNSKPSF